MLLLILNTPPPYQGTTIMNDYLIQYLDRKKVPFIHLNLKGAESLDDLGSINLNKIKSAYSIVINIFKYYKKYKLSYLVMSVEGFAFYRHCLFVILLKILGKDVILHLRGLGFRNKKGIEKLLTKFVFRNSYLIQHSTFNSFDIESYSCKKIFYVPNGWQDIYSSYKEHILKRKKKNSTDTVNIIFLSNLIESKGLFTTLSAIESINKFNPALNCLFHFVGNWENETTKIKFFDFVNDSSISHLIGHIGPLFGEDKYTFLSKMDLLVFPTFYKHETWGNVILEAMMLEIPVIATNYVAIPEMIIDGVNGFLIEPYDSKALYYRTIKLIQNNPLRVQMGEAGRQIFLNRFTLDKFEDTMFKIFFMSFK